MDGDRYASGEAAGEMSAAPGIRLFDYSRLKPLLRGEANIFVVAQGGKAQRLPPHAEVRFRHPGRRPGIHGRLMWRMDPG